MDAHAGALARGEEPRHHCRVFVAGHFGLDVGRDAAHGVVGRGLYRYRLLERLHSLIDAGEVGDVRQLLLDHLSAEVADVEVEVVLAADAAAGPDLLVHRPADHVARSQLHQLGSVVLHEALALVVE